MREDHIAGRGATPGPAREDLWNHTRISAESLAAIDRASDLDAAWFACHSDRAYRLRPVISGEHLDLSCPPGRLALTLVKQIRPGIRSRAALWATRPPCACDACLDDLWEQMLPAKFRAGLVAMAAAHIAARP